MAALMVVASHLGNAGMPLIPGLDFSGTGKYGVYLFFVLSAFLLTDQLLRLELADWKRIDPWRRYFVRRVLRIFPLYAVVLVASWALAGTGWVIPLDTPELVRHLTLAQGKDIFWRVPVEFKYYFAIPLVALSVAALRAWRPNAAEPIALGMLALATLAAVVLWPPARSTVNSDRLVDYLAIFLCGSGAAVIARWLPAPPKRPVVLQVCGFALLATIASLAPAGLRAIGLDVRNDVMHRSFLLFGAIWSGVLLCVVYGGGPAARLFCWRPLRACGHWCFGIYLLHMSMLYLIQPMPASPSFKAWMVLIVTLAAAAASYRTIERPAIRLGARF
jgi:peptidoglycan/LPS O-acetylase OafA/YrhL